MNYFQSILVISLLMTVLLLWIIRYFPLYEINRKSLITRNKPAYPLWLIRIYNNRMISFFWIPMSPIDTRFYVIDGRYIDYMDTKNRLIKAGDRVKIKDNKKRVWLGVIVLFKAKKVGPTYYLKEYTSPPEYNAMESKEELFPAFKSNHDTWINDVNYAKRLKIIGR